MEISWVFQVENAASRGQKGRKSILDRGTASASESQHQSTRPSAETGGPSARQDGNIGTVTGGEDEKAGGGRKGKEHRSKRNLRNSAIECHIWTFFGFQFEQTTARCLPSRQSDKF